MSEPSSGDLSHANLPPGWTYLNATTTGGRLYVEAWRAFHDVTKFEFDRATSAPPEPGLFRTGQAAARVGALRDARAARPDLLDAVWERCILVVYPTLGEQDREDAQAILAGIAVLRPPDGEESVDHAFLARRSPGRPPWSEAQFREHWREAEADAAPSQRMVDIAACFRRLDGELGVDLNYLRRLRRQLKKRTETPE
jgi:arylsulfatase A-like enzyme